MSRRIKPAFAMASLLLSSYSFADGLEAFQTGPIGDGYGYSVINGLQSQFQMSTTNEFGSSTFSEIPNEKISSQTIRSEFSAATGYRASPDFYIIGYTSLTYVNHSQETRIASGELSSGANTYEFGTKAVYENGPFTFGGRLALHNVGEEKRVLETAGKRYSQQASWTAIPQLEIISGYKWKNTTNMARIKFFSQGEFEVETENTGKKVIFDNVRKLPAELSLSTLVDFNHQLQLGAGVKATAAAQASTSTNVWSTQFAENGQRITSGETRDKNYFTFTAGGKFFPTPVFSLSSAVFYETNRFADESTSSLESGNFGGLGFSFASEFIPTPKARVHASTSYKIPRNVEYVKETPEESVLTHQQITTGDGSKSTSSLASFDITLGGTYMF